MITLASGDIFDADVDIRVNTVNCVGAMGAGVALAFKTRYPEMFREYKKACKDGRIQPGKIDVWKQLDGTWIINFPTKRHWREPSRYEDIEAGLADLRKYLHEQGRVSIAVPALGCGHGGLDWNRVKGMITDTLGDLDADIHLFEPSSSRAAGEQVKGGIDPHVVEQLERDGVSILKPGDDQYPEPIRGVRATTLFVKGNPAVLSQPLLTVLPSRKPDEKEVSAATACIEAIAKPGMAILLGYGPHIDRDLIRLALDRGASVAIRFEEGISNFRVRKDIADIWNDERIAVVATEAAGRWNPHTGRKMTGLALDLAKVALVTDPNPQWMQRFADDATRACQVFFIDYRTSSPAAKHALMSVGATPVRRDARSGNPSVDEIITALGVGDPQPQVQPAEPPAEQAEPTVKTQSTKREGAMPRYPKRLIEVDLPIKRISAHARREKSIRHGHISTLHIWWARRPLAACRAVICASLWPDPADELCPSSFREAAEREMRVFAKAARSNKQVAKICDGESWKRYGELTKLTEPMDLETLAPTQSRGKRKAKTVTDLERLRGLLLDFIADAAAWEASTNTIFLQTARNLTQVAHEALGGSPGTRPLVIDPFAGGGAIPLEALRVGADAFASDLNPLAVLVNKVVLEYVPKYGQRLADAVRTCGQRLREQAKDLLAEYYPEDADGGVPIAYLWARTIRCEGPTCGVEIPLIRNPQLTRKGRTWYLNISQGKDGVDVTLKEGATSQSATVNNGSATCPCCGFTTPAKAVRAQLVEKSGGSKNPRLLAVYVENEGSRYFRPVSQQDVTAFAASAREIESEQLPDDLINPIRPYKNSRGLSAVTRIGITRFGDLYTPRQALAIITLRRLALEVDDDGYDPDFRRAVVTLCHFIVSRYVFQNCAVSRWNAARSTIEGAFGKQALQVVWDFAEANPFSNGSANWNNALNWVVEVIEATAVITNSGQAERVPAQVQALPDTAASLLATDPPYFAAIPYSDLANVFYVWERELLKRYYPDLYRDGLIDQDQEIIVTNANRGPDDAEKNPEFFKREMQTALASARRTVMPSGLGIVVFADSSTESWESILGAVIDAGWIVTGSWPIDTEMQSRTQAAGAASLQSSVHIVCRPRETSEGSLVTETVGDWRDVLSELPRRIHEWLPRLAEEGIVGADAIFACLGPALEVFSRYSRVEKASGEQVLLRDYLEHVWAAVSKEALGMIFSGGDATGFEEDARLTAMWLWTIAGPNAQSSTAEGDDNDGYDQASASSGKKPAIGSGGYALEYDAARKIAQGLGAHLEKLTGMVEVKGNKARLLSVAERTKSLFGKDQTDAPKGQRKKKNDQMKLDFMGELEAAEKVDGSWARGFGEGRFGEGIFGGEGKGSPKVGETILDRLHQSMILFAAGRGEALRSFLVDEGIGRDQRYWRLAQALSALYPAGTDDKRWVDGVLARKKSLGF